MKITLSNKEIPALLTFGASYVPSLDVVKQSLFGKASTSIVGDLVATKSLPDGSELTLEIKIEA